MGKIFRPLLGTVLLLILSGCTGEGRTGHIRKETTCAEHQAEAAIFHKRITDQFEKLYFRHNDIKGAQMELLSIMLNRKLVVCNGRFYRRGYNYHGSREERHIDGALDFYNDHYTLAKKKGCDMSHYREHPLKTVANRIKALRKK